MSKALKRIVRGLSRTLPTFFASCGVVLSGPALVVAASLWLGAPIEAVLMVAVFGIPIGPLACISAKGVWSAGAEDPIND
jgi:hypothetical protein